MSGIQGRIRKTAPAFHHFPAILWKTVSGKRFRFPDQAGETRLSENLELFRIPKDTAIKCVNDEEVIERRIETHSGDGGIIDGTPGQIPIHCYLRMFYLEQHENCWVRVQNLEEYQYRPELKERLGLAGRTPQADRYFDCAITDMLVDDIVEGE